MTDGGLTQDDFRRLLQTPREPPKEPEFKAPAPKTPKPANGRSVFAVPHALRKKRPRPAPREKDEEQDNEKNVVESTPRYRDRAAERRMQQDETAAPEATPIKKGLDFELLRKTRAELSAKQNIKEQQKQEQASSSSSSKENGDEDDDEQDKRLEEALKENVPASDEPVPFPAVDEPVKFNSVMAKNIYDFIRTKPPKNELFAPGRMAFVFELADEVGHYNDAYAIPTSLIRSRADKKAALDDLKQKTELVVSKISKIMSEQSAKEKKKREEQEKKKKVEAPIVTFDGDIFADVGRDYELDEETLARASTSAAAAAAAKEEEQTTIPETTKGDYFKGLKEQDEEEDVEMKDVDVDMASLLSQAAKQQGEEMPGERPAKKQRFFQEEEMDADANDIDMFGLGASALPTSFEERRRTVAYGSGDEDEATTSMLDQGTHRNKKAQLTRWDFDDEEQWQKYKDSIEIMPKSASQYGVKMGDGRKRNREQRKGMSEKQKLNREYQMVKSIMEKKYGTKPAGT